MTTFTPIKEIEELQAALQKFVEACQPDTGVAYLLYCVEDDFYIPIACSQKEKVLAARTPYHLLFSRLRQADFSYDKTLPLTDSMENWASMGRIESLVFDEVAEPVYQQFTMLADGGGPSLVLVRSTTSPDIDEITDKDRRRCSPLLSLVFKYWCKNAYDGLLRTVSEGGGEASVDGVISGLVRILDDRDAFPPYWPFTYFSVQAKSGVQMAPKVRTNPLGFTRWSLKELQRNPWIIRMASLEAPAWDEISETAKSDQEYGSALDKVAKDDPTTKFFIDNMWDWVVPVSKMCEWRLFARHNKIKGDTSGADPISKPAIFLNPRNAISAILRHEEHHQAGPIQNAGDFLVTLWALKVNSDCQVTETIPFGCRVAKDFSGIIPNVHESLVGCRQLKQEACEIEVRYSSVKGYDEEKLNTEFVKLERHIVDALKKVNPITRDAGRFEHVCGLGWGKLFNYRHEVAKWRVPGVTEPVFEELAKLVITAVNPFRHHGNPAWLWLETFQPERKFNYVHIAKGFQHSTVTPELLAWLTDYDPSRLEDAPFRKCFFLEDEYSKQISEGNAASLLTGCILLKSDGFYASGFELVDHGADPDVKLLECKFVSRNLMNRDRISKIQAAMTCNVPQNELGSKQKFASACNLLKKNALTAGVDSVAREGRQYQAQLVFRWLCAEKEC